MTIRMCNTGKKLYISGDDFEIYSNEKVLRRLLREHYPWFLGNYKSLVTEIGGGPVHILKHTGPSPAQYK
jgi:hypothetical protein